MRVQNLFVATQLLLRRAFLRRIGLPYVVNNSIGSIRLNETDRSSFAVSSLWGKFGGLYACGATFPHTVPLPNIFVTHLFSNLTLKRKDFPEIVRAALSTVRGCSHRSHIPVSSHIFRPTVPSSLRNIWDGGALGAKAFSSLPLPLLSALCAGSRAKPTCGGPSGLRRGQGIFRTKPAYSGIAASLRRMHGNSMKQSV